MYVKLSIFLHHNVLYKVSSFYYFFQDTPENFFLNYNINILFRYFTLLDELTLTLVSQRDSKSDRDSKNRLLLTSLEYQNEKYVSMYSFCILAFTLV